MSFPKRRLLSNLLSSIILCSMLLSFYTPLLTSSFAQETSGEPPPAVEPETIEDVSTQPELPSELEPQPPISTATFVDTFEDGNTEGWLLSDGWALATTPENKYLTATTPSETAIISGQIWGDVSVDAWLGIDPGNTANIAVRVSDAAYIAQINSAGTTSLYKGNELIARALTPTNLAEYVEVSNGRAWYQVNISALGSDVTVSINGQEQLSFTDDAPLPAGYVVFSTGAANTGTVVLDEVSVQPLGVVVPEPVTPTDPDTPAETPTDVPEEEPTPEPTVPVETPTNEPEGEEPPAEPIEPEEEDPIIFQDAVFQIVSVNTGKLGQALQTILDTYVGGDESSALALAADYFIPVDAQGRLSLIVWANPGTAGETLAAQIQGAGGYVEAIASDRVTARIPLGSLQLIAELDSVSTITVPERGVTTGTRAHREDISVIQQGTGPNIPHSIDIVGANSWHLAGYEGGGVNIAVIDTGFNAGVGNVEDRACLGSSTVEQGAGSGSQGIEVVEVICDMAPLSTVWMYSASNSDQLIAAVQRAARLNGQTSQNGFPRADLILVTMDPGATLAFSDTVNAAVSANIPVIVSAGNNGNNQSFRFSYQGQDADLTVLASAGSVLSYNWEDGAGAQNYPTELLLNGEVIDSRPARTSNSSHQYIVPASCGDSCTLTMRISGEGQTNFRTQIAGGNELGQAIYPGDLLVPLASGSLSELASLDSVISVGAVCAWQTGNGATIDRYQVLPNSSTGAPNQPNNGNIKPSLVGPARVSTSITPVQPECEGGFDGTAAAAAHVAGAAALVMSNPNMQGIYDVDAGVPTALKSYLQTRTIDLHVGASADGFDNVYGAGLIQLGNPAYNLGLIQIPNRAATGNFGSAYYVGTPIVPQSGIPDGSPTNPFTHPAQAIARAVQDQILNVVLLPGEYVTSFEVPTPTAIGLTITSFDAVDSFNWQPSAIWVNDTFEGISGINLNGTSNVGIDGLQFTGSTPLYEDAFTGTGTPPDSLQIAKVTPIDITDSTSIVIRNNTFTNFDSPVIIENSEGVVLSGNTFDSFDVATTTTFDGLDPVEIPLFSSAALFIQDSGETDRVFLEFNIFQNNTVPLSQGTSQSTVQESIVNIERSQVDIFTSRFINNVSESVISVNQWQEGTEAVGEPGANALTLPVVIYSTLFDSNDSSGSLVQMYQAPVFRFINNTVVNHRLDDTNFGFIIGLGHGASDRLNLINHRWEMHNNLFYNNTVGVSLIGLNNGSALGSDGCLPIGGNLGDPQNAARNNWFAPSMPGGECSASIGGPSTPLNNNIYTQQWESVDLIFGGGFVDPGEEEEEDPCVINPEDPDCAGREVFQIATEAESAAARAAFEAFYFLTAENDPDNPYRIRPTPDEVDGVADPRFNLAVDTGDNAVVFNVIPGVGNTSFDLVRNLRPIARPPVPGNNIDIGAYELGTPTPAEFIGGNGVIRLEVAEDEPIVVDMRQRIQGGFEPYRMNFTNLPQVYDTNPLNACGGQPTSYDRQKGLLTYCPPPDFYNQGLTATYPNTQIAINYEAFGLFDSANQGTGVSTLYISITPVAEIEPLPSNDTDPRIFIIDPTREFGYRLEPFFQFNAAGNLELSNPDASVFAQSPEVDYPFTYYSDVTIDVNAPQFNPQLFDVNFPEDPAQLTAQQIQAINNEFAQSFTGIILRIYPRGSNKGFTPETGETGAIEFTYTVEDSSGDTAVRRVRIRIVESLGGADPGGEDGDTGDTTNTGGGDGDLTGGGVGSGLNQEIQHIGLHDDASLDFQYSDGWLPFYYQPAVNETLHYSTGAGQTVDFSFDGDAFAIRFLGFDGGGSFGLEIDHDDDGVFLPYNDPSMNLQCTNQSTASNIPTSRSTLLFDSFGCSGFELTAPDALRTLRITTISNTAVVLDAIEVRGANLLPGYYQSPDYAFRYSEQWQSAIFPGPAGDSLLYTNTPNSTMRFAVNGDLVDSLILYRSTGSIWGAFEVRFDGQLVATVESSGSDIYFNQAYVINGVGDGDVQVEIRTLDNNYIGLEAIELIRNRGVLGSGYYPLYDGRIRAAGAWGQFNDATSNQGITYYNAQPDGGALLFTVDATKSDRLIINHAAYGGSIKICGRICTEEITHNNPNIPYTVVNFSSLGISGEKENISINVTGFYVGIEAIQLASSTVLPPGYYDQIRDAYGITYTDAGDSGWFHVFSEEGFSNPGRGGTSSWAITGAASAGFNIPADATGLVIYHAILGNLDVCADDGTETCFTVNATGTFTYGGRTYISAADLGMDGSAEARITIRPSGAQWAGWEGVQVLGAPEDTQLGLLTGTQVAPNNGVLRYVDTWARWDTLESVSDMVYYSVQPNAAIMFKFEGQGLNITHVRGFSTGNFEVCIDATNCQTVQAADANAVLSFGNIARIDAGSDGLHVAEIRSLDAGWIGIESIGVFAPSEPLVPGYYQQDNKDLAYTGTWTSITLDTAAGGALKYGSGSAGLTFTVDSAQAGSFVVYHPNDVTSNFWGSMQVCIDGQCQTTSQSGAARRYTSYTIPAGATGLIEISPSSSNIGIEAIRVLPRRTGGLGPGMYDDVDFGLSISGGWQTLPNIAYKGGSVLYSSGSGSIDFTVDATQSTAVAIHHPGGLGWGSIRVCGVPETNCQTINLATATSLVTAFTNETLGLTGNNDPVSVEWVSGWGGFDAVEIVGAALTPGYYEEDSSSLTVDGTWLSDYGTFYSGSSSIWTNSAGASVSFNIGGGTLGTDPGVTGFTVFVGRYAGASPMEICYVRQSDARETCVTETTDNTLAGGAFESIYGISVFGLAPLTIDTTANETYAVTISYAGSGSAAQYLGIDSIAVLGQTPGRLTQGVGYVPKVYDDDNYNIVYSPAPLWLKGHLSAFGLYENSYAYTTNAGATAQVAMDGNALTMYHLPFAGASDLVEFCLVVGSQVNSTVQCSEYALNDLATTRSKTSAITLYGFGFGPHDLYITNRDNGGGMLIDAILVR